jgi:hypothetical protein
MKYSAEMKTSKCESIGVMWRGVKTKQQRSMAARKSVLMSKNNRNHQCQHLALMALWRQRWRRCCHLAASQQRWRAIIAALSYSNVMASWRSALFSAGWRRFNTSRSLWLQRSAYLAVANGGGWHGSLISASAESHR